MVLLTGARHFSISLPAKVQAAFVTLLLLTIVAVFAGAPSAFAQSGGGYGAYSGGRTGNDAYVPPADEAYVPPQDGYDPPPGGAAGQAPYRPGGAYSEDDGYRRYDGEPGGARRGGPPPGPPPPAYGDTDPGGYGEPYHAPGGSYDPPPRHADGGPRDGGYSQDEIVEAGGRFFGSVTKGLASVIEHAFRKSGRPNGYILGTDGGGAFIAGLRYGEGTLYTKDAGTHRVYWQGPSIGYDFGGEGSKTMVLVYNLQHPDQIYERYAGVQGSAYVVGGVGIQYQTHGNVTLAPIRSGIGLRLGANVGYLKYTRSPTWNPF
ncbi:EipA family protein [Hyphomicrobium sulfonivorans]|uniref:EipA family protein n=1 Tax=Hyphomicrobium sulfonivorans TaxID=121290 RepID=UPI00156FA818|nr:DUF1134 domain-containing protein [Hyphomicrobium sulfonivorans]NSL70436.1 DUF1134 domain-containing protein [Hyphomicrobium sulfonivorans]